MSFFLRGTKKQKQVAVWSNILSDAFKTGQSDFFTTGRVDS